MSLEKECKIIFEVQVSIYSFYKWSFQGEADTRYKYKVKLSH